MTPALNDAGLTDAELRRIYHAEARAYEELYTASAAKLGTGSERIGESTAIWYPEGEEAGYNCLVNFHLAADKDSVFEQGLARIERAGSKTFGIPVDERVSNWATAERIGKLGLTFESTETIWGRRIDPTQKPDRPALPGGFAIGPVELAEEELTRLINLGWNLEPDDARGKLFSTSIRILDWTVIVVHRGGEVAGISVLCCYEEVGILMLAVVLPDFCGRGRQSWFIAERLAGAASRGATGDLRNRR